MIKKLLLLLALMLPAVASQAQLSVGSWALHSPFIQAQQIIETPQRAYFLSSGSLFYVDKETSEQGNLNSTTGLNDVDITGVYYNPYGKYILLTYANGNMDKVFDSGRVINVPDIKDAVSTDTRDIREVAFGKDFFAVLTSFGLVTYNDATSTVRETIYDPEGKLRHIAAIDKYLIINQEDIIKAADASKRLTKLDQFQGIHNLTDQWSKDGMKAFGNGILLMDKEDNKMQLVRIDFNFDFEGKIIYNALVNEIIEVEAPKSVDFDSKGLVKLYGSNALFAFNADGTFTRHAYPSQLQNSLCSAFDGVNRTWASLPAGIAQYDISSSTPTELRAPFSPSDLKVRQIIYLTKTPSGGILATATYCNRAVGVDMVDNELRVNLIENGEISELYPLNNNQPVKNYFKVMEIPGSPGEYVAGTWNSGLYKFKDGKVTAQYNSAETTSLGLWWGNQRNVTSMCFDSKGNLYCIQEAVNNDPNLHAVPLDKLKQASTKASDWSGTQILSGAGAELRDAVLFVAADGTLFAHRPSGDFPIAVINTKNTASMSDNVTKYFSKIYDQDNKEINVGYFRQFVEDKNGQVWFGAGSNGICVIENPASIIANDIFRVRRIKVPRNDGTNLADYLCDSQEIGGIAVDASNRKWIATLSSGVYLVSEDGTEIIEHYTKDNSPLPSNRVYSVACDETSGSVYFGTEFGLVEYNSTSAPSSDNYNDVYAYPNPVRPEYTGWITVDGLMNNSLVKIADAAGNVFAQGRSDGGRFIWDGCNPAGERVKTGVYYVYASQSSAEGGSSGCVTKILVVN